jgi:hypothetical protein
MWRDRFGCSGGLWAPWSSLGIEVAYKFMPRKAPLSSSGVKWLVYRHEGVHAPTRMRLQTGAIVQMIATPLDCQRVRRDEQAITNLNIKSPASGVDACIADNKPTVFKSRNGHRGVACIPSRLDHKVTPFAGC